MTTVMTLAKASHPTWQWQTMAISRAMTMMAVAVVKQFKKLSTGWAVVVSGISLQKYKQQSTWVAVPMLTLTLHLVTKEVVLTGGWCVQNCGCSINIVCWQEVLGCSSTSGRCSVAASLALHVKVESLCGSGIDIACWWGGAVCIAMHVTAVVRLIFSRMPYHLLPQPLQLVACHCHHTGWLILFCSCAATELVDMVAYAATSDWYFLLSWWHMMQQSIVIPPNVNTSGTTTINLSILTPLIWGINGVHANTNAALFLMALCQRLMFYFPQCATSNAATGKLLPCTMLQVNCFCPCWSQCANKDWCCFACMAPLAIACNCLRLIFR